MPWLPDAGAWAAGRVRELSPVQGDHLDRGSEKVDNDVVRPRRGFRGIEDALSPEEWEAEQAAREEDEI